MFATALVKPLGEILQQAGLVSAEQIAEALKEQAGGKNLRFGEILARRGWIKQETADFFAEQWVQLLRQKPKQPLGQYLKAAGLLDEQQISHILKEQEQTGLRFGVLAVLKGWVKQATIDFFLEYLAPDHQSNLAEHLKTIRDRLLNNQWCDSWQLLALYQQILQQGEVVANDSQEQLELLSVGLVVKQQGKLRASNCIYQSVFNQSWVEQELARLRPYGRIMLKILKLEEKAARPYTVLEEVLSWTGRQPILTQKLCQLIYDSESFIPAGEEAFRVEHLVQSLIDNWETQAAAKHLQEVRARLVNNNQCTPFRLLKLYQQILQHKEVVANYSREQLELLSLGLVVKQQDKLRVSNRIYESVFDWSWVNQELVKHVQISTSKVDAFSQVNRVTPVDIIANARPKYANKKLIYIGVIFLVSATILVSINAVFKLRKAQIFQQGNKLLNAGEYQNAITKYDEVLKNDGNYYQAWTNRGYALARMRKYNQMLSSCSVATIVEPKAVYAWNCQGEALHNLKRYKEAIAMFDKAIAINPEDQVFWINKSESLLALQQTHEALRAIEQAIYLLGQIKEIDGKDSIGREFSIALSLKGKVLHENQQYGEALAAYNQSLDYTPDYLPAQQGRAIVLRSLRRYDEASAELDNILNYTLLTDAQKAQTWLEQGLTLCEAGQFPRAIAAFEEALKIKPNSQAAEKAKMNCISSQES